VSQKKHVTTLYIFDDKLNHHFLMMHCLTIECAKNWFSPVSPKPVSPKPDSPKPVSPKPDLPNLGKVHSTCSCSCFMEKNRTPYHYSITFVVRTFRYCNSEPSQHSQYAALRFAYFTVFAPRAIRAFFKRSVGSENERKLSKT